MTMDVERIAACSPAGGPPDWDFAARSVRSYCEILRASDFAPTLFVVPDTADTQAELLIGLSETTGAELGMHMHPQCWRDNYLDADRHEYLGGYTGVEQRRIIGEGREQWEGAIGFAPRAFRGGNFSANDETFQVLVDAGFTHGSVSQPGRVLPQFRAVWAGAIWDVHRPHEAFRNARGDLDFVEIPLTSDRTVSDNWTGVGDVRIESASADSIVCAAKQEVLRQIEESSPVKHVCILTHNFVNYWSENESDRGRQGVLESAVSGLMEMGQGLGLEVCGVTTAEIRETYLDRERG